MEGGKEGRSRRGREMEEGKGMDEGIRMGREEGGGIREWSVQE